MLLPAMGTAPHRVSAARAASGVANIANEVASVVHRDCGHTTDETPKSVLSWGMGKEAATAPVLQMVKCVKTELKVTKILSPRTLDISIDSQNFRRVWGWNERGASWVTGSISSKSGWTYGFRKWSQC